MLVILGLMKRTTIYLDSDLEVRLKIESMRRRQPMAEMIREALRAHLDEHRVGPPPGAGEFDSGHADTEAPGSGTFKTRRTAANTWITYRK